jgi:hypothetical protein
VSALRRNRQVSFTLQTRHAAASFKFPMARIPIIFCIDIEPDVRTIEPTETKDWEGFETAWSYFASVRPALSFVTGDPVHYSWFVRMDPQVSYTYGTPNWAVTRYGTIFSDMQQARDEIGLHTHAWRWDDAARGWISDFADQEWIEHCVRQSFEHYALCFNRPCESFRFGDRWLNQQTAEMIECLGARFNLSVEPGRKPESLLESFTGSLPDYSLAPRQPYHPSKTHFMRPSTAPSGSESWMIPISTASIQLGVSER